MVRFEDYERLDKAKLEEIVGEPIDQILPLNQSIFNKSLSLKLTGRVIGSIAAALGCWVIMNMIVNERLEPLWCDIFARMLLFIPMLRFLYIPFDYYTDKLAKSARTYMVTHTDDTFSYVEPLYENLESSVYAIHNVKAVSNVKKKNGKYRVYGEMAFHKQGEKPRDSYCIEFTDCWEGTEKLINS